MKFLILPPHTAPMLEWGRRLSVDFPEVSVVLPDTLIEAEDAIVDADAAFGTIPKNVLAKAKKLRWLQAPHAAPNTRVPQDYYYPELVDHPLVVTSFCKIYNDHVGAHAMMYVLNFARGMHYYYPRQMRQQWQRQPSNTGVVSLPKSCMLIVGVGGIGGEVARLANAFGMRVLGVDSAPGEVPAGMQAVHPASALDTLLPQADFVVLTVPHTPVTEAYFDYERFCRMKEGAFFVNVGRGKTVVLNDLVRALSEKKIAGAGLDVFDVEPVPENHPLWGMEGVFMTPHMGGYGAQLDERRYDIIRDNLQRFIQAQPLRNIVDKNNWF